MKVEDLVKRFDGDRCLLCGGDPVCVGIFTPNNPQLYGAAAGKSRFFRYCLCDKCKPREDTPDKVEKVIWAELAAGGVTYAE